ncbi:polysaccharide biosynthesis C-terminal domain-containing protein [Methylobacterium organophilum]|uniref:lipopolysaccharide biosynthesis protein n=1 Tax=Methylobacterium organophilum TaxID=410 RepID=UPI001F140070|nr:polysaccharide biosynthesis C-terminal domain-containing protein [Methylobacterium organophilum]UMY17551.1 polysaccharide biosynthesis C-terminal domain-containing protein [Methylobacterium organophilum]
MAVLAAFVVNAGLNFVLGLLIAKLLGPADFGRFALATAGAVVLNTLLFEWLRLSATRFYSARVREAEPWIRQGLDRAYAVTGLALFAAAALCGGLGLRIDPEPEGRFAVAAATALAALAIGLFDYHAALARARFVGGTYLRLVVWKNLFGVVLMGGTALLLPQPVWVLLAGGASQFLAVLVMRAALRDPKVAVSPHRARETLRLFARYGLPLIAANAIYQLLPFVNRGAIVAASDFAEAGYFALAADLGGRVFTTFGTALDLLLFQLAVRAEEHHGRVAAEAQVSRNLGVVVALLLPAAAGYWAVTPALQGLLVPEAYRGPFALYTALLLPGILCLSVMHYALNPIFQIRRRTGPVVLAAALGLAVNALGILWLPPLYGPAGVAAAQTLGLAAAVALLAIRALAGRERLALPWRDIALAALGSAAMLAALTPLRHLPPAAALALCLPLGAAIYGGVVWGFDVAGLRGLVTERISGASLLRRKSPSRAMP